MWSLVLVNSQVDQSKISSVPFQNELATKGIFKGKDLKISPEFEHDYQEIIALQEYCREQHLLFNNAKVEFETNPNYKTLKKLQNAYELENSALKDFGAHAILFQSKYVDLLEHIESCTNIEEFQENDHKFQYYLNDAVAYVKEHEPKFSVLIFLCTLVLFPIGPLGYLIYNIIQKKQYEA